MKNQTKEWQVSPFFKNDLSANRKSNITSKKKSKFFPNKKIAVGNEGIGVELIHMTDLKDFASPLAYMVNATRGGKPEKKLIDKLAKEMFDGGLQHALENIIMVFELKGVSRAFTHQIVRHRKWGFHQQSFRWTSLEEKNLGLRISPHIVNKGLMNKVKNHWEATKKLYRELYEADIPFQDCRDLLPIGTQTYMIVEVNLREFINTFAYRGCSIFQPQMVYVVWQMRKKILKKYPQLEKYIQLSCQKTKKCMYQGWENTEESCKLEYANKRIFKSNIYK